MGGRAKGVRSAEKECFEVSLGARKVAEGVWNAWVGRLRLCFGLDWAAFPCSVLFWNGREMRDKSMRMCGSAGVVVSCA